MQIRRLRTARQDAAWPLSWVSSDEHRDRMLMGEEGILESVERFGDSLSLTMRHEGDRHRGVLRWEGPPWLPAVEKVLRAHIGESIISIGDLEV